jgi:hypothetical protein
MKITALILILSGIAYASPCVVSDGACVTTHADETPFEGPDKAQLHILPVLKYQLSAVAILKSTDTASGKDPIEEK